MMRKRWSLRLENGDRHGCMLMEKHSDARRWLAGQGTSLRSRQASLSMHKNAERFPSLSESSVDDLGTRNLTDGEDVEDERDMDSSSTGSGRCIDFTHFNHHSEVVGDPPSDSESSPFCCCGGGDKFLVLRDSRCLSSPLPLRSPPLHESGDDELPCNLISCPAASPTSGIAAHLSEIPLLDQAESRNRESLSERPSIWKPPRPPRQEYQNFDSLRLLLEIEHPFQRREAKSVGTTTPVTLDSKGSLSRSECDSIATTQTGPASSVKGSSAGYPRCQKFSSHNDLPNAATRNDAFIPEEEEQKLLFAAEEAKFLSDHTSENINSNNNSQFRFEAQLPSSNFSEPGEAQLPTAPVFSGGPGKESHLEKQEASPSLVLSDEGKKEFSPAQAALAAFWKKGKATKAAPAKLFFDSKFEGDSRTLAAEHQDDEEQEEFVRVTDSNEGGSDVYCSDPRTWGISTSIPSTTEGEGEEQGYYYYYCHYCRTSTACHSSQFLSWAFFWPPNAKRPSPCRQCAPLGHIHHHPDDPSCHSLTFGGAAGMVIVAKPILAVAGATVLLGWLTFGNQNGNAQFLRSHTSLSGSSPYRCMTDSACDVMKVVSILEPYVERGHQRFAFASTVAIIATMIWIASAAAVNVFRWTRRSPASGQRKRSEAPGLPIPETESEDEQLTGHTEVERNNEDCDDDLVVRDNAPLLSKTSNVNDSRKRSVRRRIQASRRAAAPIPGISTSRRSSIIADALAVGRGAAAFSSSAAARLSPLKRFALHAISFIIRFVPFAFEVILGLLWAVPAGFAAVTCNHTLVELSKVWADVPKTLLPQMTRELWSSSLLLRAVSGPVAWAVICFCFAAISFPIRLGAVLLWHVAILCCMVVFASQHFAHLPDSLASPGLPALIAMVTLGSLFVKIALERRNKLLYIPHKNSILKMIKEMRDMKSAADASQSSDEVCLTTELQKAFAPVLRLGLRIPIMREALSLLMHLLLGARFSLLLGSANTTVEFKHPQGYRLELGAMSKDMIPVVTEWKALKPITFSDRERLRRERNSAKVNASPSASRPQLDMFAGCASGKGELFGVEGEVSFDIDIFKVDEMTNGNCLMEVGMGLFGMLDAEECLPNCDLHPRKVQLLLYAMQGNYHDVPYHNRMHAALVAQHTAFFLRQTGLQFLFSSAETAAAYVAALGHDIGHPGVTNYFLTSTSHYLALAYNDVTVLENYHAANVFKLLEEPTQNIFSPARNESWSRIRRQIIDMILVTDMGAHKDVVAAYTVRRQQKDFLRGHEDDVEKDKRMCLQMCIKTADLSYLALPAENCSRWTLQVYREFWDQGDMEADLGLPKSPLCDRSEQGTARWYLTNAGFGIGVVMPMLIELSETEKILDETKQYIANRRELKRVEKGVVPRAIDKVLRKRIEDNAELMRLKAEAQRRREADQKEREHWTEEAV